MVQPLSVNTAVTEDPSSVPRSPKQKGARKPDSHREKCPNVLETSVVDGHRDVIVLSSHLETIQRQHRLTGGKQAPGSEFIFLRPGAKPTTKLQM